MIFFIGTLILVYCIVLASEEKAMKLLHFNYSTYTIILNNKKMNIFYFDFYISSQIKYNTYELHNS